MKCSVYLPVMKKSGAIIMEEEGIDEGEEEVKIVGLISFTKKNNN